MKGVKGGKVNGMVDMDGMVNGKVGESGKGGGDTYPDELYALLCFIQTELYIAGKVGLKDLKKSLSKKPDPDGPFACLYLYAEGFVDGLEKREPQKYEYAYLLGYSMASGKPLKAQADPECGEVFQSIRRMLSDFESLKAFLKL